MGRGVFSDYGWVPFDVTYGEYGWIDPTHIKFKDSLDSDEPSTYFKWIGSNANLRTRELEINTNLVGSEGYSFIPLKIQAEVFKKSVNFGSYNLVEATFENPNDFYYAATLDFSAPKEVLIVRSKPQDNTDGQKSVLLRPGEKKKVYWIVKVDDGLEDRYSYSFPIIISTMDNVSTRVFFSTDIRQKSVSFSEIGRAFDIFEEVDKKPYSANLMLDCNPQNAQFYEYEHPKLICTIQNTGNLMLDDLESCFEGSCKKTSLGISQSKEIEFGILTSRIGERESIVAVKNGIVIKNQRIRLRINDVPSMHIENLSFPSDLSYGGNFTVSFMAAKKSFSNPKNLRLILALNGVEKEWNIDELRSDMPFAARFFGSQLRYGTNSFAIRASYRDELGKDYVEVKEFSSELRGINAIEFLVLSLNSLSTLSANNLAFMLIISAAAFMLIVLLVFRGKSRNSQ